MSTAQLNELEREVEAARARVSSDLARLRSPAAMADFKHEIRREAFDTKDALVGKATQAVKDTAQDIFTDIKRRAAANPAAALAIGAGVAWHLIRKPPVSSLLIGLGLVSLMKTTPSQSEDFAEGVARQAKSFAAAVEDKAQEWGAVAGEKAQQWGAAAKEATQHAVSDIANGAASLADRTSAAMADATQTLQPRLSQLANTTADAADRVAEVMPNQETRDQLLLGTAALAVAAAVGISFQRRSGERHQ